MRSEKQLESMRNAHAIGTMYRRLRPIEDRFSSKVNKDGAGGCWLWLGKLTEKGYGIFVMDGKSIPAHRVSWELTNGQIPEGLQIDHLCRVRACVNPVHLEPVTNLENTLRGENFIAVHAAKTHCSNGHPFDEINTRIDMRNGRQLRVCRTCQKVRLAEWNKRHPVPEISETGRHWWIITVGAGYGEFNFYGTEQQAEEMRYHKANWEHAVATKRRGRR